MNHYILIPVISTLAGLLFGWLSVRLILRRFPLLLNGWMQKFLPALFSAADIKAALSGKSDFSSIGPVVEPHIDEFLNHRLGKEMPMIGMFIGDKTIAQLKAVFMKELEEIFPLVMDKYLEDLSGHLDIETLITKKLRLPQDNGSRLFLNNSAGSRLATLPLYSALAGLATGIVQDALLFLLS